MEGLQLNFSGDSWYLGGYLGPKGELDAWVLPQVEEWVHRVCILGKISKWHPQLAYTRLGGSL